MKTSLGSLLAPDHVVAFVVFYVHQVRFQAGHLH